MTHCKTTLSLFREFKNTRIIATRKLTTDQLARFLVFQDSAVDPLEYQNAWGTGRNDLALRG